MVFPLSSCLRGVAFKVQVPVSGIWGDFATSRLSTSMLTDSTCTYSKLPSAHRVYPYWSKGNHGCCFRKRIDDLTLPLKGKCSSSVFVVVALTTGLQSPCRS